MKTQNVFSTPPKPERPERGRIALTVQLPVAMVASIERFALGHGITRHKAMIAMIEYALYADAQELKGKI